MDIVLLKSSTPFVSFYSFNKVHIKSFLKLHTGILQAGNSIFPLTFPLGHQSPVPHRPLSISRPRRLMCLSQDSVPRVQRKSNKGIVRCCRWQGRAFQFGIKDGRRTRICFQLADSCVAVRSPMQKSNVLVRTVCKSRSEDPGLSPNQHLCVPFCFQWDKTTTSPSFSELK